MEFIDQLRLQLKSIFGKLTPSQKISFLLIVTSIAVLFVVVALWSGKPDYVVLYSDLSTDDAGKIHAKLAELKVPFQLVGTTIKVPQTQVYETRLALANEGLPKGSHVGFEIFDKTTMGQTDYLQRLNYQRALEGELCRTISSLDTVEFARIHLVMPKPTIFSDKAEKTSASVVITPRGTATLSKQNVTAIIRLVSAGVEGLAPEDVTVIDSNGNLLSGGGSDGSAAVGLTSNQLEAQQNIERYLETKVSSLLMGVLGPGKAIVRVSADIDFSQKESTEESFDPKSQVARSENRIEESSTEKEGNGTSSEKTVTNYEINKTVEHIIGATGSVKRLSLAVVVDGTYKLTGEGKDKKKEYVARTAEENESIKKLVVSAIGVDATRKDTIEVINIPFDTTYLEEQRVLIESMQRSDMVRAVASQWPWLLVVIVFGALLMMLKKIINQAAAARVVVAGGAGAGARGRGGKEGEEMYERMRMEEEAEREKEDAEAMAERLTRQRIEEEVANLATKNPDAVARIVKGWLQED